MRQHAEKGYRIAQETNDLAGIADLILKHHERWDGKGYPLGLAGEDIPVECRILAIVDSFDAMTNDRPYRKALTAQEALEEIARWSGTQFDPHLVKHFLEIMAADK
jgi:HD-GYP domain-containing protein (c-di-GMP phosphodiesterase class II)